MMMQRAVKQKIMYQSSIGITWSRQIDGNIEFFIKDIFEEGFHFHAVRRFNFFRIDLIWKEELPDEKFEDGFHFHAVRRFNFL